MTRNLVMLLSSGHTVKIALRPDDFPRNALHGTVEVRYLLELMPAVLCRPALPSDDGQGVIFAYIESMTPPDDGAEPDDFQRIDAYSPGEGL